MSTMILVYFLQTMVVIPFTFKCRMYIVTCFKSREWGRRDGLWCQRLGLEWVWVILCLTLSDHLRWGKPAVMCAHTQAHLQRGPSGGESPNKATWLHYCIVFCHLWGHRLSDVRNTLPPRVPAPENGKRKEHTVPRYIFLLRKSTQGVS